MDFEDVVPSFLGIRRAPTSRDLFEGGALSNSLLRLGEVQEIVYPTSINSHSNKFIEYSVLCEHRENGMKTTRLYTGCILMNVFGGLADFLTYTLRAQDSSGLAQGSVANLQNVASGLSTGSKVLLLCVNGETFSPVIIGGVRQFLDSDTLLATPGSHFLTGMFNGFKFDINDAGELILTYGGANDSTGAPRGLNPGPSFTGTTQKFVVDGSWSITAGAQSVLVDNTAKKIDINAATQFNVQMGVGGLMNFNSPKGPFVVSCDTAVIGAANTVSISGGTGGVFIGSAPAEALMLGTTYRVAQAQLHTTMASTLQVLGQAAAQAAQAGVSGAPALATAVAAACIALMSAIQAFEGAAQSYLSPLNRCD